MIRASDSQFGNWAGLIATYIKRDPKKKEKDHRKRKKEKKKRKRKKKPNDSEC